MNIDDFVAEQDIWAGDQWLVSRPDAWHVEITVAGNRRTFTNRRARKLAWALLAAAEQGDGA